jgi:hypothetical protein
MKKRWPTLAQHASISHQIDEYMLKFNANMVIDTICIEFNIGIVLT